jgi:hypothetical protein
MEAYLKWEQHPVRDRLGSTQFFSRTGCCSYKFRIGSHKFRIGSYKFRIVAHRYSICAYTNRPC